MTNNALLIRDANVPRVILTELDRMRDSTTLCDLQIHVPAAMGNSSAPHKVFPVHRCVLAAASEHFAALVATTSASITIQHVDQNHFATCLDFIYGRDVYILSENLAAVGACAEILQLRNLAKLCEDSFQQTRETKHPVDEIKLELLVSEAAPEPLQVENIDSKLETIADLPVYPQDSGTSQARDSQTTSTRRRCLKKTAKRKRKVKANEQTVAKEISADTQRVLRKRSTRMLCTDEWADYSDDDGKSATDDDDVSWKADDDDTDREALSNLNDGLKIDSFELAIACKDEAVLLRDASCKSDADVNTDTGTVQPSAALDTVALMTDFQAIITDTGQVKTGPKQRKSGTEQCKTGAKQRKTNSMKKKSVSSTAEKRRKISSSKDRGDKCLTAEDRGDKCVTAEDRGDKCVTAEDRGDKCVTAEGRGDKCTTARYKQKKRLCEWLESHGISLYDVDYDMIADELEVPMDMRPKLGPAHWPGYLKGERYRGTPRSAYKFNYVQFHQSVSCDVCGEEFQGIARRKRHEQQVHADPLFCSFCAKSFPTLGKLHAHEKTHQTMTQQRKCRYCDFTTLSSHSLQTHTHREHADQASVVDYLCPHCAMTFMRKHELAQHELRVHFKDIWKNANHKHKCSVCDHIAFSKKDLRNHLVTHSNIRPYVCQVCQRAAFKTVVAKNSHIRKVHGMEPPDINRKHTEVELLPPQPKPPRPQKVHPCSHCSYVTKSRSNYNTHMKLHSDDRPFQCTHCPEAFKRRDVLVRHGWRHHNTDLRLHLKAQQKSDGSDV